jgi:Domain of unknown function (DUF1996)
MRRQPAVLYPALVLTFGCSGSSPADPGGKQGPPTVAISATASTFTLAPDSIAVSGTAQLVIRLVSAAGARVGANQTVSVSASGGTSNGTFSAPVFEPSDTTYRAVFTGTRVGTDVSVRVTAASVLLEQARAVRVTAGPVSLAASTLTTSADSVAVGSGGTIIVIPRDAAGNKKGAGLTVTLSVDGGTSAGILSAVSYLANDSSYRATYIGQTPGTAHTVRAAISGAAVSATRSLTVSPPRPQTFVNCSPVGTVCQFIGLRDVRLVASNGVTYTQTFYAEVPCAQSGFEGGFTGAPSAPYTRCEIGEMKTQVLMNPMPGMAGLNANALIVPLGDPGVDRVVVGSGPVGGASPSEAAFRMTCNLVKMDFFDPIVYPGAANSAHLHMFFGNAAITPNSTAASVTSSGAGSCLGGTVNRTGYWVPALFDSRTSAIIPPDFATIYYKSGYNVDPTTLREIPAGLLMIAGNKNNVGAVQTINQLEVAIWSCTNTQTRNTGAVANCPVGDIATLTITFPQCWDGVNLDSPDHQSHMAYPDYRNPPQRSTCPASHPVMLPVISEIFHWKVEAGMDPNFWRLTSDMYPTTTRGGYSAHADWMNGWDQAMLRTILTRCLQAGRDCQVGLLGDGRQLF